MIRLKGEKVVNQAIDSRLERESSCFKKSSTVVQANCIFQKSIDSQKIILQEVKVKLKRKL